MINEIINMNGYGVYVWSAFSFTLVCFTSLYLVIKAQYIKERNKFILKFGSLDSKQVEAGKTQKINIEILSSGQII